MKKILNIGLQKALLLVFALTVILALQITALADPQTHELVTVSNVSDMVIQFTFDVAQPNSLVFISPSGQRYEEGVTDESLMKFAKGDLWSNYMIYNAEVGTWMLEYDLGSSEDLQFNVQLLSQELVINNFTITNIQDSMVEVNFHTAYDGSGKAYTYEIYAVADTESGQGSRLLTKGTAMSDKDVTENVWLTDLTSYNAYKLRLEVYTDTGYFEVSDSAETEAFEYTNPYVVSALNDVDITVDTKDMLVTVDWQQHTYYNVFVSAFADGAEEPIFYYDTLESGEQDRITFDYTEANKDLKVCVYVRDRGILSEPLIKEFSVHDLAVTIDGEETLNRAQTRISYNLKETTEALLTLNEKSQNLIFDKQGEFSITLIDGYNEISVSYVDNGIKYIVSKDIYVDRMPPSFTLFEDIDKKTFSTTELIITGQTEPFASITINNNSFTPGTDGSFSCKVTLQSGKNVLNVKVEDAAGNGTARNITVFCNSNAAVVVGSNSSNKILAFLPLIITLALSLIGVLLIVLLLKKRNKAKLYNKELSFKINMLNIGSMICFIIATVVAMFVLLCTVEFIRTLNVLSSETYLSLAEKSVDTAYTYIVRKNGALIAMIIGGVLFALLIAGGIILKTKFKKFNTPTNGNTPNPPVVDNVQPPVADNVQPPVADNVQPPVVDNVQHPVDGNENNNIQ